MKRLGSLLVVLVLTALPVMPMPRVCCYIMPPSAAMHPCCPATAVRIPAQRATLRVTPAPPATPTTTLVVREATAQPLPLGEAPGALSIDQLSTIQLRI